MVVPPQRVVGVAAQRIIYVCIYACIYIYIYIYIYTYI